MADITMVPRKLKPDDVMPNYDFQLGVPVNTEEAEKAKSYLEMFIRTNFEVIESNCSKVPAESLSTYLSGVKDMLAFVNLWIDSLNTEASLYDDETDINE